MTSNNTTEDNNADHFFAEEPGKYILVSFLVLVILFTACGNGLVLWALKRFVTLRRPAHIFLGGLAFVDFLMIVPQVLKIVTILTENKGVCVAQGVCQAIVVCCVSLHLGCISVERFVSIKYALRYEAIVTKTKVYISVAFMWTLSILATFVIPFAIGAFREHFETLADGILTLCTPERENPSERTKKIDDMPDDVQGYSIFMFAFFFCVPCLMISISNTYIFIASSRQRRKILSQQPHAKSSWTTVAKRLLGDLKAARTLFIIEALFIVAYFPYFSLTISRIQNADEKERKLFYASKAWSFLTALTSCLNPIIYVHGNQEFKKAFRKLLHIAKKHDHDSLSSQQAPRVIT